MLLSLRLHEQAWYTIPKRFELFFPLPEILLILSNRGQLALAGAAATMMAVN